MVDVNTAEIAPVLVEDSSLAVAAETLRGSCASISSSWTATSSRRTSAVNSGDSSSNGESPNST